MDIVALVLHFDRYLPNAIAQYGATVYLLLFMIVCCEIGIAPLFFLPGDPLLFVCGAFCATGALDAWILGPVLFVATVVGSSLGYGVGRVLGHAVLNRKHRWLHQESLQKTARFYERYGGMLLIFSPYIAVVRTFAPLLAGVFELGLARFVQFNLLGALLWVAILLGGGYAFGNIPQVREHLSVILLSGVMLAALLIAAASSVRLWRALLAPGAEGRR
jgi:membrane-associated protein